MSTEEKDAVACAVHSKQKDAKLAARNPQKIATAFDLTLTPALDEHSTLSSFSQPSS